MAGPEEISNDKDAQFSGRELALGPDNAGVEQVATAEAPQYELNRQVAVLRSTGVVEYDWTVSGIDEKTGQMTVQKPDPDNKGSMLEKKNYPPQDLANIQPKYAEKQRVIYNNSFWLVNEQRPNGDVLISQDAPSGPDDMRINRRLVPAARLKQEEIARTVKGAQRPPA